jgi:hypothetical protein
VPIGMPAKLVKIAGHAIDERAPHSLARVPRTISEPFGPLRMLVGWLGTEPAASVVVACRRAPASHDSKSKDCDT